MGKGTANAWFEEIYRMHRDMVFGVCYRFSKGDREWALDRTQETFLRAVKKREQVQTGKERSWLYKIAARTCLLKLRRERTWTNIRERLGALPQAPTSTPEEIFQTSEGLARVGRVFSLLPRKQQSVLHLIYLEELPYSEIARILKISKGQVSKLHKRALNDLYARGFSIGDQKDA